MADEAKTPKDLKAHAVIFGNSKGSRGLIGQV